MHIRKLVGNSNHSWCCIAVNTHWFSILQHLPIQHFSNRCYWHIEEHPVLLPVILLKLEGCTMAERNITCKSVDNYVLIYLKCTCHTRMSTTVIHTEIWLIWAVVQGTCAVRTTPLASFGSVTVKHSSQLQSLHMYILHTIYYILYALTAKSTPNVVHNTFRHTYTHELNT